MADNCIFCKLANGEIPTRTLYEDNDFRIILDTNPLTYGHALILPKKHAENLFALDEETVGKAHQLARQFGAKMMDILKADGMNILQNNGLAAGQSVFHFHIHLIPRYKEDKVTLGMESKSESKYDLDALVKEFENKAAAISPALDSGLR